MQSKTTIFGPPGTGKTTYLMTLLEDILKTYPSNKIAFVSFTKQGTYEGADRAKRLFKLKEKDLPYFKTIHALCFQELELKRSYMIDKRHYKLLSEKTGINFTGFYTEDFSSTNDAYLHAIAMEKHNKPKANRMMRFLLASRLEYIRFQYGEMKKQLNIIDFNDMLCMYLEKGKSFDAKIVFIDEAQDLTPLQWEVVGKMFKNAEKIYVAGDDDQAIYEWSGAAVELFLDFSREHIVLNKSYRMPEKILQLSKRISRDIKVRKEKLFLSKGAPGEIISEGDINSVKFNGGELVMARTNWILKKLAANAMNRGAVINFKGHCSIRKDLMDAVRNKQPCALQKQEQDYYEKVLKLGWDNKKPIQFETFHSSKGTENEHTIVSCDISARIADSIHADRDAELRCLYVGMTRSKDKLTLLQPTGKEHYPIKYFS